MQRRRKVCRPSMLLLPSTEAFMLFLSLKIINPTKSVGPHFPGVAHTRLSAPGLTASVSLRPGKKQRVVPCSFGAAGRHSFLAEGALRSGLRSALLVGGSAAPGSATIWDSLASSHLHLSISPVQIHPSCPPKRAKKEIHGDPTFGRTP